MRRLIVYILLLTVTGACKEKYDIPHNGPSAGYLVVDGFINSSGQTNIKLSRTLALVDSVASRNETNADVWIEGDNNTQFHLDHIGEGMYQSADLSLLGNVKYRLRIRTADSKIYFSAFTPNKKTPNIDGISWERTGDGVDLYINTHDATNSTTYYRWDYHETWEFHSAYLSSLQYIFNSQGNPVGIALRPYDEMMKMYTCWQDYKSTNILVGSSAKLSRDTIHLLINFIPGSSWKLSVKYSILVRQYALSASNFEFLQRMKKNTEQVGSLFDAQPSELVGNIQCADNLNEVVIGFVEVSEMKEKRIFIDASEVAPWGYRPNCYVEKIVNHPDSLVAGLIPTSPFEIGAFNSIISFFASTPICVDCTTLGYNTKPSFWP